MVTYFIFFYLVYILMEKEMATHSIILIWENPWIEKPGRLQSMGLPKVRHNLASKQQQRITFFTGKL